MQLCLWKKQKNAKIQDDILRARPKNTGRALHPKQKEFINWTKHKGYENPEMVTEDKVAIFLSTTVLGRPSQKNALKTVGKATVDQYVTALTDLWKMQSGAKLNNHPTPQGHSVRAIQKQMGRTTDA